jgi:hypothetical protein
VSAEVHREDRRVMGAGGESEQRGRESQLPFGVASTVFKNPDGGVGEEDPYLSER